KRSKTKTNSRRCWSMASIDKRPNGTYRARWREYAGGPQKTRSFRRKVDADNFLDTVRGNLRSGTYVDPEKERQTFTTFADEWAESQDWKATSRQSWAAHRKRLVALIGEMPLGAIDRLKLQSIQQTLLKKYARSTTTITMSYAGAILRAAHVDGRIGRDPTR